MDNNLNANSAPDSNPNAKYRKAYDEYPDFVKESYSFDLYTRLVAKCNKVKIEVRRTKLFTEEVLRYCVLCCVPTPLMPQHQRVLSQLA